MSQYPEFAFVILHYMAKQETIDCVASILEKTKAEPMKVSIVIVDNASANGTGRELQQLYQGAENIYVILNRKTWALHGVIMSDLNLQKKHSTVISSA